MYCYVKLKGLKAEKYVSVGVCYLCENLDPHYEKLPMLYVEKIENFFRKKKDIFKIFAQTLIARRF